MIQVKILGSGCSKCIKTAQMFEQVAMTQNCEISVSKITDPEVIMSYDVMSTPAVVIDEKLVHSGSIPSPVQIANWLNEF